MTPFYLLLLPALVYANIAVYIDLRTEPPLIDVTGRSWIPIPEEERASFQLDEKNLNISVANYSEAVPTDVFVRNGKFDLYKTYNWEEVRRWIKPTLETKTMDGNKISPECNPVNSEDLKNTHNVTFSSVWSSFTVPTNEVIEYTLIINDTDKLNFTSLWGKAVHEYETYLPSKPVSKCLVQVYLEFVATLSGDVAANYLGKRQGSHFWKYDVNSVLDAVDWPISLVHQEHVTIEYYK